MSAGVTAHARVRARPDGRGGTALPVLQGDGPLALRRVRGTPDEAGVLLVGAMSGPLGGDRLTVTATAGPGARLRIGSAAATLALPGQRGGPAEYGVSLAVGPGARLVWAPEQLISASGSDLRVTTRAEVEGDGRLVLREEQILGRTGELAGTLTSRLTVRHDGRTLLDQELACGPGAPGGWDGPAVLGGRRALGQLVVVDTAFAEKPVEPALFGSAETGSAALTPLAGPAVLVTALAPDARLLRRLLDEAAAALGAGA
ncbi:urease accessory protein [Streptomyces albidoflavus]|uniref:urease accessory protein UreD n=1 Tax=Streptomyces albidoflavus TaxID=1886 RepID=UPI00081E0BE5|nr:urease accessory protein UreD [Streptomyces albidoflavus]RZE56561.1 urease accessory protein [Streptomyces albidoflavus]RZE68223.1 urease accessory protein [Streptomyces albidoflavus]WTE00154.1 urease accessory protein UreD [Streptomyces albidoflavus]SCD80683.1 urease accessory protein [Streptomyces sp. IgraMP-1]